MGLLIGDTQPPEKPIGIKPLRVLPAVGEGRTDPILWKKAIEIGPFFGSP